VRLRVVVAAQPREDQADVLVRPRLQTPLPQPLGGGDGGQQHRHPVGPVPAPVEEVLHRPRKVPHLRIEALPRRQVGQPAQHRYSAPNQAIAAPGP
jgi:hypothetical protein